jgi:glycosyltransferase involved in cell wall biosynthesis
MPYFSIVMPTLNRAALLPVTIQSIEAQSFTDYEILLVDGGSTDGTLELAPTLSPKLRLLRQPIERRGIAAQRSTGFAEAKGQYIVCLDSDDTLFPWSLQTYRDVIEKNNNPSFMLADGLMFWDEAKLAEARQVDLAYAEFPNYFTFLYLRRVGLSVASGSVMKTEVARQTMGLSDKIVYAEDSDMFMRMGEQPGFVRIQKPLTFGYRQHGSNVSVNFDRLLNGMGQLIEEEKAGTYPGGRRYSKARRMELTTLLRSAARRCVKRGRFAEAWDIYCKTIFWNAQVGNWHFLLGFPFKLMYKKLKGDAAVPQAPSTAKA